MAKLFVMGLGRSGTTVLNDALNTCPEIVLLGEPSFYAYLDTPGFRASFNGLHSVFQNQRTKGAYAPRIPSLDESATARDYLDGLEQAYAYVGEKIALSDWHDFNKIRAAFELEWSRAPVIWTVRRPRHALASSRRVFGTEDLSFNIHVAAHSLLLMIEFARLRRQVFMLVTGHIGPAQFTYLGQQLGVDLSEASKLYRDTAIDDDDFGRDTALEPLVERLDRAYDELVRIVDLDRCAIPQHLLQASDKLPPAADALPPTRQGALGWIVRELMDIAGQTRREGYVLEPT